MEHAEAVNSQAVDRYLLGSMPEAEAQDFERHFFACRACAEELDAGTLLAENLRALPAPAALPVETGARWWEAWAAWRRRPLMAAPALAAVVLAGIAGYQAGVVIPALRARIAAAGRPQALLLLPLRAATRGEENRLAVPSGAGVFALEVDLEDHAFPNYRCTLRDAAGAALFSVDSPAPAPGNPLRILVPLRGLQSGTYTLEVRGVQDAAAGPEAAHYSFLLQLQ